MASQEHRYSAYELLPHAPSSTKWIIDDAQAIPEKLKTLLHSIAPIQIGPNALGETYEVEDISWVTKPDLSKSFHNATLTRDLQVTLICTKKAAGQSVVYRLPLSIPNIPFPNHKGAFSYVADEYFGVNYLTQKDGIFPISTEERKTSDKSPEILWKTPSAVIIQGKNELFIQTRIGNRYNQPILVPREYWEDLSNTLENLRNKKNPRINLSDLTKNEGLRKIIKKAVNRHENEASEFQEAIWLQALAEELVPDGSWANRLKFLSAEYPHLAEPLATLMTERQWSLSSANAANRICEGLPEQEILDVGHISRLKVETASDRIVGHLFQTIKKVVQEARTHEQSHQNSTLSIVIPWSRRSWETEVTKFFNSKGFPKTINEEPTPQSAAIKANLIKHDFRLVKPAGPGFRKTDEERTSHAERRFHPSAIGFIATASPESENVGEDHWLCAGAVRDPLGGEVLRPTCVKVNGAVVRNWLNAEDTTHLEASLAKRNSGIHLGIPDPKAASVPLRQGLQLVRKVKPEDVEVWVDYRPEDMLPLHIAMAENVTSMDVSRQPMLHAGENNARTINGSEAPRSLNDTARQAAEKLTNIGSALVAPVTGKVVAISTEDAYQIIKIEDAQGALHLCEIPRTKVNAFKGPIGTRAYVTVGEIITAGHTLAGPDHPAYERQLKGRPPGAIHCGTNLNAVILPKGIEDQMIVSSHLVASGRLDETIIEREETEREDYDIHLCKIAPGTMIHPNEVLAYQIVDGKQTPIVVGPDQGGILNKVTFITDFQNDGKTTAIRLDKNAPPKASLMDIVDEEIKQAAKAFSDLVAEIDPFYVIEMKRRDKDVNACIEKLTLSTHEGPITLPLKELLDPTSKARKNLRAYLSDSRTTIDPKASYLNERFFYAKNKIETARRVIQEAEYQAVPPNAKRVVFEISRTRTFSQGSKMSDTSGTKGVTRTDPHMPLITIDGQERPAELSVTSLAVLARGSLSRFTSSSRLTPTEKKQETLLRNSDGSLSAVQTEVIEAYELVQKSSTTTANKVMGNPEKQGRGFRDENLEGVNMSPESRRLGRALGPLIDAAEMEPGRLAKAERYYTSLIEELDGKPAQAVLEPVTTPSVELGL